MEGEGFTPPIVRIVEKVVSLREKPKPIKVEHAPRSDEETALALAHIAASWAAYSGFGTLAYYHLQHPQVPNKQDGLE